MWSTGADVGAMAGARDGVMDYEAFYVVAYPQLHRLALARSGDRAAADDLVQDALADAHRRWDRIGCYDAPLAWARRAVLNRSASRWRRLGREAAALARLSVRDGTEVVEAEPGFPDEGLWTAVRALPRRQLEVVLLLWFEELTVAEVAATLGCGEETVRTHWRRARERLSRELSEDEEES